MMLRPLSVQKDTVITGLYATQVCQYVYALIDFILTFLQHPEFGLTSLGVVSQALDFGN